MLMDRVYPYYMESGVLTLSPHGGIGRECVVAGREEKLGQLFA